jgi:N-acetylneuraminic acid mutarotase
MRIVISILLFLLSFDSQASQQWYQRADYGNFGRHRSVAVGVGNKAYAGTGHLNGVGFDTWYPDWWQYDPSTNSWMQKADYPGNNGDGDENLVAVELNGKCYAGLGTEDQTSFYEYDPISNIWTQKSSPPGGTFWNTFPFVIDNIGYFPALWSSAFYRYDATTDTWTYLGALPQSTTYGTPTFAVGGKGYIRLDSIDFYEYDPGSNLWTQKADFPGYHKYRPRGINQNGYGFFIGGFHGDNPSVLPWYWGNSVWRYDPTNNIWDSLPAFPGSTRRWAVICNVNERVFYGLGTNGTNFDDWWEFNSIGSIDEFDLNSFSAYPNPVGDHVQFNSSKHFEFEVVILDISGRTIISKKTSNGSINLQRPVECPSGMYIYEVRIEDKPVHSDKLLFR